MVNARISPGVREREREREREGERERERERVLERVRERDVIKKKNRLAVRSIISTGE